jgi:type II secretory pathway predicted ATPase ExeA
MRSEVRQFYGFTLEFDQAGYYETAHLRRWFPEIETAMGEGKLIILTGGVGSGKTVTLRRLESNLRRSGQIALAKSLCVEKERVNLRTLMAALFYDLSSNLQVKIPSSVEQRERQLCQLISQQQKPVALLVDDAHDLPLQTLGGLLPLMKKVADSGGILSIVLAGRPQLQQKLRQLIGEEIGAATIDFDLDSIAGEHQQYIEWLLRACTATDTAMEELVSTDAIDLLATRCQTPLQIQYHLELAFEAAHLMRATTVTDLVVSSILSQQSDEEKDWSE